VKLIDGRMPVMTRDQILFSLAASQGWSSDPINFAVLATRLPDGQINLEYAGLQGPLRQDYFNDSYHKKAAQRAVELFAMQDTVNIVPEV
jgi:hypothetical protein